MPPELDLTEEEILAVWQRLSGFSSLNDPYVSALRKIEAYLDRIGRPGPSLLDQPKA